MTRWRIQTIVAANKRGQRPNNSLSQDPERRKEEQKDFLKANITQSVCGRLLMRSKSHFDVNFCSLEKSIIDGVEKVETKTTLLPLRGIPVVTSYGNSS